MCWKEACCEHVVIEMNTELVHKREVGHVFFSFFLSLILLRYEDRKKIKREEMYMLGM